MLLEINRLQTLINKLRQEVVTLTKDRDILLIDIWEQRRGKNEVYKEYTFLLENRDNLQKQITLLSKEKENNFNNFIKEYWQQKRYLEEISKNKINEKDKLEIVKKQKEEFDKQNINLISLKKEIIERQKQLNKIIKNQELEKQDFEKSKTELNNIILQLKKEQEKIAKEKESLILLKSELQELQDNL